MAKKKLKTLIGVVLDETGSMGHIAAPTRSAFNEWLQTVQKEDPSAHVTMVQFSDTVSSEERARVQYDKELVKKVAWRDEKNYLPRGVTPLYDAVGTLIRTIEGQEKGFDRVLVMIQTDGLENASRDFTREDVTAMVKEKEGSGTWTFAFVGLGIDGWSQGGQMVGMASVGSTFSASASAPGVKSATRASVTSTSDYLSSQAKSVPEFYNQEKKAKKS